MSVRALKAAQNCKPALPLTNHQAVGRKLGFAGGLHLSKPGDDLCCKTADKQLQKTVVVRLLLLTSGCCFAAGA